MKNLLKSNCLIVALIATIAIVGCGGGGGGGTPSSNNPAAPVNNTLPNEALATREAVLPILQNANAIFSGSGANTNSNSNSNSNSSSNPEPSAIINGKNSNEFGLNQVNANVIAAIQTPNFVRAVISEIGGNIDSGLWENESRAYFDIATFSNNVYERTVYDNYYYGDSIFVSGVPYSRVGYLKIEGCSGELSKDNVLTSLSVKSGAKITFERTSMYGLWNSIPVSFTGTIGSDFTVKWEGKEETFDSPIIVDRFGNQEEFKTYEQYRTNHKLISKATYSFSNQVKLHLDKLSYFHDRYYSEPKEYEANLNIEIDGINEFIDTKTIYCDVETKDWEGNWKKSSYKNIVVNKRTDNLKYTLPITISLNGKVNILTHSYNSEAEVYEDNIKYSGSIKDLTFKINKMSGDFDTLVIDDADIHVEPEEYKSNKALKIGDHDVDFNAIKIDVSGLIYNYNWKKHEALYNNCYTNAKATFTAEETIKKVEITGDCDVKAKTANISITNHGDYLVKESANDKIMEFNFKTVDIKGTNVDILANNKCDGALLEVKGIEKDGTTSERTYKVVNGKLVLNSSKDKQAPATLPQVNIAEIPEEISNSNSIEVAVSEAKPNETVQTSDPNETLKVGKKGDLKVASYEKKPKNGKNVSSKISAKNNIIAAISFYGNKEFTVIFVIDFSNKNNPQIKGSIFSGERNNITMDTVENRIGQFAGKDGKMIIISSNGYSEVSVK